MGNPESMEGEGLGASRRSFLMRGVQATAAGTAALAGAGAAQAAGKAGSKRRVGVLATSTTTTTTTSSGNLPEQYSGSVAAHFKEILNNENDHISVLLAALGSNARPRPTFQNIVANTVRDLAVLGGTFCATGAGAYLASGPAIYNKAFLAGTASFSLVESAQASWINSTLNLPLVPSFLPYWPALTPAQVMTLMNPYIASLNNGPPATYDPANPSPENDIAILNFALILEYAENELYNTYVPKFFGA